MIVPALALFSFSVVAQAAGVGKPNVAAAAAKVVPEDESRRDDGVIVVVKHDDDEGGGIGSVLGHGKGKEVCWISTSQLARVAVAYRTTTSSISIGGKTYTLVTVYGADEKGLQRLLGVTPVQCRLVHTGHVFFLPFDPNIS